MQRHLLGVKGQLVFVSKQIREFVENSDRQRMTPFCKDFEMGCEMAHLKATLCAVLEMLIVGLGAAGSQTQPFHERHARKVRPSMPELQKLLPDSGGISCPNIIAPPNQP